jgi:murein DD-endopeptidase MepM/ murein hydrolase activator NlpD
VKRVPLAAVLLAACATAPVPRTPWEEAFGKKAPPKTALPPLKQQADPRTSPELHAALFAFSDAVAAARVSVTRGAKMGVPATAAWAAVLAEVDRFLARPAATASPFDVARARLVLQAELEADAQLYGDFPEAVTEGTQKSLAALTQRLAQVAPVQHLVDLKRFIWPVTPVVVTSPFGHRFHPIHGAYRFHSGTDLLADPAQPVRAAYDGVVRFAGWNGGSGKQIEVQHDARFTTRYSHLQTLLVGDGRKVKKGEIIGLAGSTGQSTGVHLHFELTRNGFPEDPEDALAQTAQGWPGWQNGTSPGFPRSSFENPRHFEAVTASP